MRQFLKIMFVAGTLAAQPAADDPVIRITTNLVQIDAVVTDGDNRPVTDLAAEDFQILQDGKPRPVTAFSFVRVAPSSHEIERPAELVRSEVAAPLVRPGLTRQTTRRTVAIVVNDLNIDFADMVRVREAIGRFVREELGEQDMAAIVAVSGGMGVYAQFTNQRSLLEMAAGRLRWNPRQQSLPQASGDLVPMADEVRALQRGSLGAIQQAIRAMRRMPGRKAIVLFTSGLGNGGETEAFLQGLADEATRSAVSIYPIDARGLRTFMPTAETQYADYSGVAARAAAAFVSQGGMAYLADRTGGVFIPNDNGLRELMVQALDDQSSYYLLGYNPGEDSFDRRYHKIEVKVLRRGLKVRSRAGYMGVQEGPERRVLARNETQIVRALLAPFQESGIRTMMSSAFRTDDGRARVQSQLWIDARDLEFARGPGGRYHTIIEVLVANFSPDGVMSGHTERGYRLNLDQAQLDEALRSGLLFSISTPVKKPGPYQVRMALRQRDTDRMGTASQFLLVPDVKKKQLALSGIVVPALDARKDSPQLDLIQLGRAMEWEVEVYHPSLRDGAAKLMAKQRLYRGDTLVFETPAEAVESPQGISKRNPQVAVRGTTQVGIEHPPGEYVLQVIVTDENDKAKAVSQTMSFPVAR